jgi:hypothetical protein
MGRDLALGELTDALLQMLLLVTQLKIQNSSTACDRFFD